MFNISDRWLFFHVTSYMLTPLRTTYYFIKKISDITRNNVDVNITSVIESFCHHVSAESFVIHDGIINKITDFERDW